ncbi:TcfC E-set like domain-containing protein [Vibrio sp. F13]|uniref:TcfC E-set like domain-containing protein n=1 Tax=Vibrio sp. F13 TaxID=2070777 RepID=UPI0010BDBFBF|nr:TcfC E-set like domain-containing protein [Vibrio sp. F13]TKG09030.1 hypothetical protein FCV67_07930 [Vibrio sp. F13]
MKLIPIIGLLLLPFPVFSDTYPDEFSEFFAETPQTVHIALSSGEGVFAQGLSSYNAFRILEGSVDMQRVIDYLQQKGLKDETIDTIRQNLTAGVSTSSKCTEDVATCIVVPEVNNPEYVFDFDYGQLRVFVASNMLAEQSVELAYASSFKKHSALVNTMQLYAYEGFESDAFFSASHYTTLGLPLGHIYTDGQVSIGNNTGYELYNGYYEANFWSHKLQAGRTRYNTSFNTTDMFAYGASLSTDGIYLGSSRDLFQGDERQYQKVFFYSPTTAQLEVYQGERLLLSRVVQEGQQQISYAELPSGVYDITVILKVSGQTLLTDERLVVNNQKYLLNSGAGDYIFGIGKLNKEEPSTSERDEDNNDVDKHIARIAATYQVSDGWLVGSSLTANTNEQYYQAGLQTQLTADAHVEYVYGLYSNDEVYQRAALNWSSFFIDFSKYDVVSSYDNIDHSLSEYMYGDTSYLEVGVGTSLYFGSTSWYGRATYQQSYLNELYVNDKEEYYTLSTGITVPIGLTTLNMNAEYREDNFGVEDYNVSFDFSIPFGDTGISTQFNVYTDNDGDSRAFNYLKGEYTTDNLNAYASVGAHVNEIKQTSADISASVTGYNDYVVGSAYGYTNTNGQRSLSANLTNTQVVSTKGVFFSGERNTAYASVDLETGGNKDKFKVELTQDGDYLMHKTITTNEPTLIALDHYSDITMDLDNRTDSVYFDEPVQRFFSYPGSLFYMEAQAKNVQTALFVMDDIFGQPISSMQCVGKGCIDIQPVTQDGVYRVSFLPDTEFRLVSRKGLCVYEPGNRVGKEESYRGYCLMGIDSTEERSRWKVSHELLEEALRKEKDESRIYFLGQFEQSQELKKVTAQLDSVNITYREVTISGTSYVYVIQNQYSQQQVSVLRALDAYVMTRREEYNMAALLGGRI